MIYINDCLFERKFYPVGEQLLEFSQDIMTSLDTKGNHITWKYKDDIEFITLYFIVKKLRSLGYYNNSLQVDYLPYARMDRIKEDHQFFTLSYVADFLNALDFTEVTFTDIHSDVALELIQHSRNVSKTEDLIDFSLQKHNLKDQDVVLVFPDKTSVKRYGHLKEKFFSWLAIEKTRDFNTGKITGFELIEPDIKVNINGKTLIIIDDICSYGGTFIGAMETIKGRYHNLKFILAVTHLEKSYYEGKLPEYKDLIDVVSFNTLDYIKE